VRVWAAWCSFVVPYLHMDKQLRIAVVDDHELLRFALEMLVEKKWPHGRVVVGCDGVDYAERCAEVGHVHIAVVNLHMLRRDGFQTIAWIVRNQPRTLPLALSADTQPPVVRRALGCGARGIMSMHEPCSNFLGAFDNLRLHKFHYNTLVDRDLRRSVESEAEVMQPDAMLASLTVRQREFLFLYADPAVKDLQEVAVRMGIKYNTAEGLRKEVAAKTKCRTRVELIKLVLENGWRK